MGTNADDSFDPNGTLMVDLGNAVVVTRDGVVGFFADPLGGKRPSAYVDDES